MENNILIPTTFFKNLYIRKTIKRKEVDEATIKVVTYLISHLKQDIPLKIRTCDITKSTNLKPMQVYNSLSFLEELGFLERIISLEELLVWKNDEIEQKMMKLFSEKKQENKKYKIYTDYFRIKF